jgi:predicted phage terminase large subunit-like protein
VFALAADPLGTGAIASLARPGGNVTGLSTQNTERGGKRIESLREIIPSLRRLAIMGNAGYPTLKSTALTLAESWKAQRVLVEDAGAGTALVQELRGRVSGIIAVKPEGDKQSRMAVASAKFEAGQVLLPERAPWLADLEAELFAFPGGRHDDQCDSISQALLNDNVSFMNWLTPTEWQAILAKAGPPARRGTPNWPPGF